MTRKVKVTLRDGIETREGPNGTSYRARVKVRGRQVIGTYFPRKRDAEAERDEIRVERRRRATTPLRAMSIKQVMRRVVVDLQRRNKREASVEDRLHRFRVLGRFLDLDQPLSKITPRTIEQLVENRVTGDPDREIAPVTLQTAMADVRALSTVLRYALREGLIRENPILRARLPALEKQTDRDWFAKEELVELLEKVRTWPKGGARLKKARDADLIEWYALTGLRITESSLIQVGDVSLPQKTVRVRKGKTGFRYCRLNPAALALTEKWIDGRDSGRLLPLTKGGIIQLMQRWADRLDEPRLHPHALRHTFGTALAADGVNAHALARAMGHESISTSLIYVHLAGRQDDAVEQLSFRRGEASSPDAEKEEGANPESPGTPAPSAEPPS